MDVPVCEVLLRIGMTIGFRYLSSKFARFVNDGDEVFKKIQAERL